MNSAKNFLYVNNTSANLDMFHSAIVASLKKNGTLPEEIADLFTVRAVPAEFGNPDGSPRYLIEEA